ncbi:hypothetical protein CEB3_c09980 [Peptococcaceae bacterium CEB3]|nr:hypothetical protein CEB3_c09980 [Peptococcaceae bacterium CEB3]
MRKNRLDARIVGLTFSLLDPNSSVSPELCMGLTASQRETTPTAR